MSTFPPLLVYVIVLLGFVVTNLILARVAGPKKKTAVKQMPYESGMDPIGDARQPFDVKFYLVAILFLVFDVELLFLYPWAASAYVEGGIPIELRADRVHRDAFVYVDAGHRLHLCLAQGSVSMAVGLPENIFLTRLDAAGQLGAVEQPVADAVCDGLLRHRADGNGGFAARHCAVRRRGDAVQPAAMRPDDRGRARGDEDVAGAAANLAADAGAEVVHVDGGVCLHGRRV